MAGKDRARLESALGKILAAATSPFDPLSSRACPAEGGERGLGVAYGEPTSRSERGEVARDPAEDIGICGGDD
jgi:hypothetical protein